MKAAPLAIALHDIEHQSGVLQLTIRGPILLIDRRGRTVALAMADGPPSPPLPGPVIAVGMMKAIRGRAKSGTGQGVGTDDRRAEGSAFAKSAESPLRGNSCAPWTALSTWTASNAGWVEQSDSRLDCELTRFIR